MIMAICVILSERIHYAWFISKVKIKCSQASWLIQRVAKGIAIIVCIGQLKLKKCTSKKEKEIVNTCVIWNDFIVG